MQPIEEVSKIVPIEGRLGSWEDVLGLLVPLYVKHTDLSNLREIRVTTEFRGISGAFGMTQAQHSAMDRDIRLSPFFDSDHHDYYTAFSHELAHFLHLEHAFDGVPTEYDDVIPYINEHENKSRVYDGDIDTNAASRLTELTGSEYCKQSKMEFIAEAFAYVFETGDTLPGPVAKEYEYLYGPDLHIARQVHDESDYDSIEQHPSRNEVSITEKLSALEE